MSDLDCTPPTQLDSKSLCPLPFSSIFLFTHHTTTTNVEITVECVIGPTCFGRSPTVCPYYAKNCLSCWCHCFSRLSFKRRWHCYMDTIEIMTMSILLCFMSLIVLISSFGIEIVFQNLLTHVSLASIVSNSLFNPESLILLFEESLKNDKDLLMSQRSQYYFFLSLSI